MIGIVAINASNIQSIQMAAIVILGISPWSGSDLQSPVRPCDIYPVSFKFIVDFRSRFTFKCKSAIFIYIIFEKSI